MMPPCCLLLFNPSSSIDSTFLPRPLARYPSLPGELKPSLSEPYFWRRSLANQQQPYEGYSMSRHIFLTLAASILVSIPLSVSATNPDEHFWNDPQGRVVRDGQGNCVRNHALECRYHTQRMRRKKGRSPQTHAGGPTSRTGPAEVHRRNRSRCVATPRSVLAAAY